MGLGDYHPKSDAERLFCIVIFICGVSIFSYIMGNLIEIIQSIGNLAGEIEEDEKLSLFISLLDRFNNYSPIEQSFKKEIQTFFNYKWESDKNISL